MNYSLKIPICFLQVWQERLVMVLKIVTARQGGRAGQICKLSSDLASLPAVICEIWSVAGDGIGATLVVVCYT